MSGFSYPVGTRYKYLPVEMSWDIFRHRHVAKTNVLSHPTANLNQSPDSLFFLLPGEIQLLYKELDDSSESDKIRFHDLFADGRLGWPLFASVALQLAQQLSGINAIFFYSRLLFQAAGVPEEHLQYAVSLTGLVNFLALAVFLPLAQNLSRKKTLTWTLFLITLDLICLVLFMKFQSQHCQLAYYSVACVLIFLVLFAIGLSEKTTFKSISVHYWGR